MYFLLKSIDTIRGVDNGDKCFFVLFVGVIWLLLGVEKFVTTPGYGVEK
jgi:hypothetical protein